MSDLLYENLSEFGYASLGNLLSPSECCQFMAMYKERHYYRKTVTMARHQFGKGEYKYYTYPLPEKILRLRERVYEKLVPIANQWAEYYKQPPFPKLHHDFLARCSKGGQHEPTPLILKYEKGDYNCLHQDLYGEMSFPLQIAICLNKPGMDFEGGEFVLTHQRPRMQSVAEVVPQQQGEGIVFVNNARPVKGARGHYTVKTRHGVSRLRRGKRFVLGIIFHDAQS
ncbi:MAG: 2OG-Fe(II) oxygenase [Sneathiellales bacterium]|nr:2OG-Fe(II) oxygenase [Sneathiellales bacterium]